MTCRFKTMTNRRYTWPPEGKAWTFSFFKFCFRVSMSLSDCKHGSNPQTDHTYSLHSLPLSKDYGKTPTRTLFDFKRLSLTNLRSISKVKVVSFLMGLTLMFLIMASHILTWDRKGLLLTPPPFHPLRPVVVPTGKAAAEVSSENNFIDVKLLVKIIGSKLEYTPRKVPDEKDVVGTNSHVSLWKVVLTHFCCTWVCQLK